MFPPCLFEPFFKFKYMDTQKFEIYSKDGYETINYLDSLGLAEIVENQPIEYLEGFFKPKLGKIIEMSNLTPQQVYDNQLKQYTSVIVSWLIYMPESFFQGLLTKFKEHQSELVPQMERLIYMAQRRKKYNIGNTNPPFCEQSHLKGFPPH